MGQRAAGPRASKALELEVLLVQILERVKVLVATA